MRFPFVRRAAEPLEPGEAYRLWAPSYEAAPHCALMRAEQQAIESLLPTAASIALDAGCGTGRYLRVLAGRVAGRRLGLDRSAAMLARVEGHDPLVLADLRALPLADATLDLIVSGLTLMDLPHPAPALAEWARVLAPGGIVVYSVLHPRGEALGWVRSFLTDDGERTIKAHWQSTQEHLCAVREAGLVVDAVLEPGVPDPLGLVVRARKGH